MPLNAHARVLYGSPLSRPRIARFAVLLLAVLALSGAFFQLKSLVTAFSFDVLRILGMALLASGLVSVVPLLVLRYLDRRERESGWLYLVAFLWGAFVAAGFAALLLSPMFVWLPVVAMALLDAAPNLQAAIAPATPELFSQVFAGALAGPIVEEALKGLGVVLLFWLLRAEFDSVRDGFIYGALVGVGFNFFESAFYVALSYGNAQEQIWLQIANRQALFGLGSHALLTGLFGLFLGLSRQTPRRWLRYLAPLVGWFLAFLSHAVNNGLLTVVELVTGFPLALPQAALPNLSGAPPFLVFLYDWLIAGSVNKALTMLPFLAIALVMLWRSGVWERRVIRQELAQEPRTIVTPEEYRAIEQDRIFQTRKIQGYNRRLSTAMVRAQNELALRKWRVKQSGNSTEDDLLVASWRDEILRLRSRAEEGNYL